jgi:putative hydrolase of the HAD superfamily
MNIRAIILDFGGVVAEEGFQQGLYAIADRFGQDRNSFFKLATEDVYNTGYVTGTTRFIPRKWMLGAIDSIQKQGVITAILSDQSNWLDRLNEQYHFFQYFDAVFNSYHLGKTKRDPSIFDDTLQALQVKAGEALFVDDNPGHIERAQAKGLQTHLYIDQESFLSCLAGLGIKL